MNYFDIKKVKKGLRVRLNWPTNGEKYLYGTVKTVYYKKGIKIFSVLWDGDSKPTTGYRINPLMLEIWHMDIKAIKFKQNIRRLLNDIK